MARDNELKKLNIKNRTCYYFDNIIDTNDLDLDKYDWTKNQMKIF